jgi:hypothetical protein
MMKPFTRASALVSRRALKPAGPHVELFMAAVADHECPATPFTHFLCPYGLIRTGLDKVGKLSDLVHLDAIRLLA